MWLTALPAAPRPHCCSARTLGAMLSQSASPLHCGNGCARARRAQDHAGSRVTATKRWWACGGCGHRFTTVGVAYPTVQRCPSQRYARRSARAALPRPCACGVAPGHARARDECVTQRQPGCHGVTAPGALRVHVVAGSVAARPPVRPWAERHAAGSHHVWAAASACRLNRQQAAPAGSRSGPCARRHATRAAARARPARAGARGRTRSSAPWRWAARSGRPRPTAAWPRAPRSSRAGASTRSRSTRWRRERPARHGAAAPAARRGAAPAAHACVHSRRDRLSWACSGCDCLLPTRASRTTHESTACRVGIGQRSGIQHSRRSGSRRAAGTSASSPS